MNPSIFLVFIVSACFAAGPPDSSSVPCHAGASSRTPPAPIAKYKLFPRVWKVFHDFAEFHHFMWNHFFAKNMNFHEIWILGPESVFREIPLFAENCLEMLNIPLVLEGVGELGAKKWFWSKKVEKCWKLTFSLKITKSYSRRQPAFPLAKNPLQRPTPGKNFFGWFSQNHDFSEKIIFVIKNDFCIRNIFRVVIENPSLRHHAPNPSRTNGI